MARRYHSPSSIALGERCQLTAERLARAGLLTEQIAADLAEAKVVLWVLRGDPPDA